MAFFVRNSQKVFSTKTRNSYYRNEMAEGSLKEFEIKPEQHGEGEWFPPL